jgi:hypothetical protein
MVEYPPFMNAYGKLTKILEKAKNAKTPDRFTYDYLAETLGFKSSSDRAFIPLAKRIGLLASDGSPTDLYRRFRNASQSRAAMAEAIRKGYHGLYERNECAHELPRRELEGLLVEKTGLQKGHVTLNSIRGTFEALKSGADFGPAAKVDEAEKADQGERRPDERARGAEELPLGLTYAINLVLPKTDDVAVFNAIFKSLREHLLGK